jgi:hypothetical protein
MNRRLFFLFPDKGHAREVVQKLKNNDVAVDHIHALAKPGVDLDGLPIASRQQKNDMHSTLEKVLWNSNLLIFFIALLALIFALFVGNTGLTFFTAWLMILTFAAGSYYIHKPSIHLSEFQAAFKHGEILLMVDVPKDRMVEIEKIVHEHHPEVEDGGVSWTPGNMALQI